jgi:hypothetical protein
MVFDVKVFGIKVFGIKVFGIKVFDIKVFDIGVFYSVDIVEKIVLDNFIRILKQFKIFNGFFEKVR